MCGGGGGYCPHPLPLSSPLPRRAALHSTGTLPPRGPHAGAGGPPAKRLDVGPAVRTPPGLHRSRGGPPSRRRPDRRVNNGCRPFIADRRRQGTNRRQGAVARATTTRVRTALRPRNGNCCESKGTRTSGREKTATDIPFQDPWPWGEGGGAQFSSKPQPPAAWAWGSEGGGGLWHESEGGLAQGLGIQLFASGGAYWPLATAHSDSLWARTCFGCVNVRGGGGGGQVFVFGFRGIFEYPVSSRAFRIYTSLGRGGPLLPPNCGEMGAMGGTNPVPRSTEAKNHVPGAAGAQVGCASLLTIGVRLGGGTGRPLVPGRPQAGPRRATPPPTRGGSSVPLRVPGAFGAVPLPPSRWTGVATVPRGLILPTLLHGGCHGAGPGPCHMTAGADALHTHGDGRAVLTLDRSHCGSSHTRTARAQRTHSANYYGDHRGNNPQNHAPAESCTINSKLKNSNI